MRALRLHEPGRCEIAEVPESPPGPGEILVEVYGSAVSVAAELARFGGLDRPEELPDTLGYEAIGRVVAHGPGVDAPAIGARVVVSAGHVEATRVRSDAAIVVPDDVPDEVAVLVILSCDVDTAIERTGTAAPVLISGAGALGLLTLFVLQGRGIGDIDVIEPVASRRALAAALGARRVLTPDEAQDLAEDYPTCFECADSPAAFELLVAHARHGARIGVISDGFGGDLALARGFHDKELAVIGCSDSPRYAAFAPWFWALARTQDWSSRLRLLYQTRLALDDLPAWFAWAAAAGAEVRPVKAWVDHGG